MYINIQQNEIFDFFLKGNYHHIVKLYVYAHVCMCMYINIYMHTYMIVGTIKI